MLRVGQAFVDISPPLGIEMAGFHTLAPGTRTVQGVRQKAELRALVIETGGQRVALVSIDLLAMSTSFADRVRGKVEAATGIPAGHVMLCATHTHSMPTFIPLRQWGAVPEAYMAEVEAKCVAAVEAAVADLAEADAYVGKATVTGGNFNRTTPDFKTNADFTAESTDAERWLDTDLQVIQFQREKGSILWYHFSAHPVIWADDQAGPDWPGMVADRIEARLGVRPSYLQGHIGDVNPGDGSPWRGDAEETASAVTEALYKAATHSRLAQFDEIALVRGTVTLKYDLKRLADELATYKADPAACTTGVWVDGPFAAAWYESASKWTDISAALESPVAALRIGEVVMLFHGSELYSIYGLQLRAVLENEHVWCVGYFEDFVGYLPDPKAYDDLEYAAVVVPKLLDYPPFVPTVGREFLEQMKALAKQVV